MTIINDGGGSPQARPYRLAMLLCAAVVVGGSFFGVIEWISGRSAYLTAEWGPMEALHSILTAGAAVIFYISYRQGRGPVKVAGGALTMLSVAAFVRELDMKYVGRLDSAPDWFTLLSEHGLQDALLIGMTLPIFIYLFIERRHFRGVVRLAVSRQAWPLYAAAAMLMISVYFDERPVKIWVTVFWEELAETYAYVFILIAAWRHKRLSEDETANSDGSAAD